MFLLPLFFHPEDVMTDGFINAYIDSNRFDNIYLAIVYNLPNPDLQKYNPEVTEAFEDKIIYYFRKINILDLLPSFFKGSYHTLPDTCKSRIRAFWKAPISSVLYKLLYPTKLNGMLPLILNKVKPDIQNETLNLRCFKSYT
jgi:hypothetical protein